MFAVADGGGVIYPQSCEGELTSWCEFDCKLLESPLINTAPEEFAKTTKQTS